MTAQTFLYYVADLKAIPKKRAKAEIEKLLEITNLSDVRHKKLGGYSGGLKQRVLLAQTLLGDPRVVILDEPTAGLDSKERICIRNFISSLSRGRIILLATHIVSDIESISDQILMMKHGHVVGVDTPGNLVDSMVGKVKELPCALGDLERMQERYKVGKGVVIAALLVYVAFGLTYTVKIHITSSAEQAAGQYTAEYAGEITYDTFARIDAEQAELDAVVAAYEDAKIAYENGEIEYPMLDKYNREALAAETKSKGLAQVRSRAEELRDKGAAEGFTPWLIDETPFESVYGSRARSNQQQAALVAVLALTLLLAGSMAYERQSGMTFLLKSTARGRGALLLRKLLLAAVTTTLVWGAVYGMEIYTLRFSFDIPAWSAPARNLSMLMEFPFNCSITGWLVVLYAYRWLCLMCGAVIVLLVSNLLRCMEVAYIATAGVMLLPSLLYAYVEIEVFRPLSLILPVEAMPLLIHENGAITQFLLWGVSLLVAATFSIAWICVSINKSGNRRT